MRIVFLFQRHELRIGFQRKGVVFLFQLRGEDRPSQIEEERDGTGRPEPRRERGGIGIAPNDFVGGCMKKTSLENE